MKSTEGNNNAGVTSELSEDDVIEMVLEILITGKHALHLNYLACLFVDVF